MEKTLLDQEIEKGAFNKGGEASSKLKEILRKLGIEPEIIRKTSIITYEMEMNIIIHSRGGQLEAKITPENIIICADDNGPGIKDLDQAFRPGYSTAGAEVRELGFGAGMGLNNIKNFSDELKVDSTVGQGTNIKALISI